MKKLKKIPWTAALTNVPSEGANAKQDADSRAANTKENREIMLTVCMNVIWWFKGTMTNKTLLV